MRVGAFREEPLPLVRLDGTRLHVNEDALQIVKDIKGPVAVISVCGLPKTGKSYLMNKMLLNKKQGFAVGEQSQEEDLILWGKPLLGQTASLDTISILLIDSNTTKCSQLQCTLSSIVIYNLFTPPTP